MNRKTILLLALCALASAPGQAAPSKKSAEEINQRLDRIEQILQGQGLLDMLQQLETLQQEVNQLRGETEVQNHTLEQLARRQRALYTDIDQRLQRLQGPPGNGPQDGEATLIGDAPLSETPEPDNPPLQTLAPITTDRPSASDQASDGPLRVELLDDTPEPPVAEATETPAIVETTGAFATDATAEPTTQPDPIAAANPVQARSDYQQAFKLLKQALYDQAIKAFKLFLSAHPDSDYADNAQYWLGEAYYVSQQFEQALRAYQRLVANYPQSQKLIHALLKIGYSKHELGKIQEAVALLEGLKQKYPGTSAARLADERLQSPRRRNPPGQAPAHQ